MCLCGDTTFLPPRPNNTNMLSSLFGWSYGDAAQAEGGSVATFFEEIGLDHNSAFLGVDGATSLKGEIVARIPKITDASQFREARHLLRGLGGAVALREELTFAGLVDPITDTLTLNDKPFNVFAQLGAGSITQASLAEEQAALGPYQEKYLICANRPDNDRHWDSSDPSWVPTASMARRHRFLTTKNLHWQWFNMLVVGMVPLAEGGVDPRVALAEVEEMKAACLRYARNTPGWSEQVGLFVNIFGHNNVNSLFIHVLDMSELGPSFSFQSFKNCPLDQVLKVLREEAASTLVASPTAPAGLQAQQRSGQTRKSATPGKMPFFFTGTDGATSVKAELVGRVPVMKDASSYREARRLLTEEFGGYATLREELIRCGFVDEKSGLLTTSTNPFNIFAMVATGKVDQPGMKEENEWLADFADHFIIACNRPVCDEHWDSEDPEWLGKASMSRRHRFLTTKKLHWQWFNALAFGLVPPSVGGASLAEALNEVERMKAAALRYASKAKGWSSQVGLFAHIFGHNSVNSLHIHILDMSELGPSFWKQEFKNCPLDAVIKVLREELALQEGPNGGLKLVTEAAAAAAKAATEAARAMTENSSLQSIKKNGEVLTLNVGGELMAVSRNILVDMAPAEGLLQKLFSDQWEHARHQVDGKGHVFLDYPPNAFRLILNQLRMLHVTPANEVLPAPNVPWEHRRDYVELAMSLGVYEHVALGQPQWGRGRPWEGVPARKQSWSLCRRRPKGPPPAGPQELTKSEEPLSGV
mmetsp:Transcript_73908/g.154004  ORF Transcript_73908/g.154004 Transcript_73908/m.154004 type:complete len:759 (+) Transcript_73908:35-2311(+)